MFQDVADAAGILFYTWEHKGETVPFTFEPNTAAGTTVYREPGPGPVDVRIRRTESEHDVGFHLGLCRRTDLTAGVPLVAADDARRRRDVA